MASSRVRAVVVVALLLLIAIMGAESDERPTLERLAQQSLIARAQMKALQAWEESGSVPRSQLVDTLLRRIVEKSLHKAAAEQRYRSLRNGNRK